MLPNQTPVKFGTYQAPLCHTLYTASIEVGCASRPRGTTLKHWTGLSRKNYVRYQTALSQISIQVLYGRLTKVSRIIFLYLRANQGFQFATSHTLRV